MLFHALPAKAIGKGVAKTLRVMQLTAILLTVCSLAVTARSVSQSVTFSGKNVKLEKIFTVIENQTGFKVAYDVALLNQSQPVSVEANRMPLADFLAKVLSEQPLTYSIRKTTIAIKPKISNGNLKNSVSFFSVASPPVTGTVRDADGNVLSGINVTIKGKTSGVITDAEGNFKINAAAGEVLVFSSVEYDAYEYKISAKGEVKDIGIELSRKISSLHAVEVNKGYYTVKDELNTGNVFTVKGEELRKQPVSDPMLALEGRVPGLMISQTAGVPGAPLNIQLRGKNFISENITANDPLYIVDGIPFSSQSFLAYNLQTIIPNPSGDLTKGGGISPFNLLNIADIENIEVLKDADATAIYGSRGANGVIIITTRKGKPGKARFDINLTQGYSKQTVTTKLLDTRQYLEMMHEAYKNDGLVFPSITTNPTDYNYDINGVWDTSRYTNWSKELMGRAAVFTSVQAGLSGGNTTTQFLINGAYTKQGTYFPGSYADQKASFHFNVDHHSLDQRFHINFSGFYSNNTNNIPGWTSLGAINQYAPDAPAIYDAKGDINWQVYDGAATWANPLAWVHQYSKTLSNNLNGNLIISYNLLKNLNLRTNFSYQTVQSTQQQVRPSAVNPPPYTADPSLRGFAFSTTNNQNWNNETQLNYSLQLGRGNLDALVGSTVQDSKGNSVAYDAKGYSSDALITNVGSASSYHLDYTSSPEYRFASLYTRIGYNWDQKYILNLTGRRDGSSRFSPKRQFGNFEAIGAAWIFSKENFFQKFLPWLSFGKILGSYGVTGSDGIPDYSFLSLYASGYAYTGTYLGQASLTPTGVSDPYYRWQRNKKLEGSMELSFLNDRINTQITYYQNRSDNQLVKYALSSVTGFGGVTTNLMALLQNSGWEVTFNTFNIRNRNFSWNTTINISLPKNKLISYPGIENSPYSNLYSVGKSIFSRLVSHYIGVDPQTGLYSFSSKTGNGIADSYPNGYTWSRPITQQYFGGIGNTIAYKGFSFDFFIQFVKQIGNSYQQSVFQFAPGYSMQNQPDIVMDRWQKPGDKASVQKFTTGNADYAPSLAYQQFEASDGVIADASFIRLKSVNLSYQLPTIWQQKAHLQNARIYLQCQNLFTLTKYQVLDPETQNLLPPVKTLTAGIQLTF